MGLAPLIVKDILCAVASARDGAPRSLVEQTRGGAEDRGRGYVAGDAGIVLEGPGELSASRSQAAYRKDYTDMTPRPAATHAPPQCRRTVCTHRRFPAHGA